MPEPFFVFCIVVAAFAAFQTYYAHPLGSARTDYEATDRPSWLVSAVLAIIIAVWRPWFTDSLLKAIVSALLMVPFLASLGQNVIGQVIQARNADGRSRPKVFGSLVMLVLVFLAFRACG